MEIKKHTGQNLRTIKLFCPSLSNTTAPFLASEDQCVDIGSIAAVFGLEPSTVKLNGHFLSRGLDLVSSVTWKSLLSFFSAKRLPIGSSDEDALVVDGKLSKVGVKRARDREEIVNGDCCEADEDGNLNGRRPKPESKLFKNKKLKYMDLGSKHMDSSVSKCNPNGYKRKRSTEEVVLLKKLKLDETKAGWLLWPQSIQREICIKGHRWPQTPKKSAAEKNKLPMPLWPQNRAGQKMKKIKIL